MCKSSECPPPIDEGLSTTQMLRQRAEEQLREAPSPKSADALSLAEMQQTLHELQVHQIELEMQNEELRQAQVALGVSRARYFELYDLAPVGYCGLSEQGLIVDANLAAASLLDTPRKTLIEQPFSRFIVSEDADRFHLYGKRILATAWPQALELRLVKHGGTPLWVHLSATVVHDEAGASMIYLVLIDISERKRAEAARQKSEERLALVLGGTQDGFWDWDLVRDEVYFSPRWWNMLGYADGELAPAPELWRRLTHPDDSERVFNALNAALAGQVGRYAVEFRLRHKDGHHIHIVSRALIVRDAQGKAVRIVGANTDISLRKRAEAALREQEEMFRLIAENLDGFVSTLDAEGQRLYNSPSYTRLVGERQISGTSSFDDVHPADRERVVQAFREAVATGIGQHLEYHFLTADGGICLLESRSGVIRDDEGRTKLVVVVSHDVTERRRAEERIHYLAFHDALTQLPNRLTLYDRLHQSMVASKRSGSYGALMFLDLDNFKPLNDTHGHEVGDLLLVEAADRLRSCVREMDTVVRFGGDEFVVMLGDLDGDRAESIEQAERVAEKIRLKLSEPYRLSVRREGKADTMIEHHCTVSIGVALFSGHEASRDELLKWVDAAMYQAKDAGRNLIRFHRPENRHDEGRDGH